MDALSDRVTALEGASGMTGHTPVGPKGSRLGRWEQVKEGMIRSDVERLLGKPTNIERTADSEWWNYAEGAVSFAKETGKVDYIDFTISVKP